MVRTFLRYTAIICRKSCGALLLATVFASPAFASWDETDVPEIDPGTIASAVTLVVGGVLMLADRRKRKCK